MNIDIIIYVLMYTAALAALAVDIVRKHFISKEKYASKASQLARKWMEANRTIDALRLHYRNYVRPSSAAFSQKEINQLIKLCHPDKHANNELSNNITKKLLRMREV